jgi:hypothetical protein
MWWSSAAPTGATRPVHGSPATVVHALIEPLHDLLTHRAGMLVTLRWSLTAEMNEALALRGTERVRTRCGGKQSLLTMAQRRPDYARPP